MTAAHAAAFEALEHLCAQELSAQEAIEQIVQRIVRSVDADAFFAGATDPDTGLCLGAGMVYTLHAIAGLEDEARAVFFAGGRPLGTLQLNRNGGRRPFSDEELEFLRRVSPLAGAALRRALLEEPAGTDPGRVPAVVVLGDDGTILSATAEAHAWLEELASGWKRIETDLPIHPELLMLSLSTLADGGAARRVRLRTRTGTWLIAHASPLHGAGQVALVIEPAKASEIAPIVVEAYGLTPREVEVTRLVARGLSTDELAAALHLSRHTVRDHVKAIFEKVGVSSRGELTSRLFAEHYHPALDGAIVQSMARVAETTRTTVGSA